MPKINMTNKKSYIWLHYKILDDSNARCNVCHKRLSYKTSISNLKKHMVKKHPLVNLSESTHYAASAFPLSSDQEDGEEIEENDSFDDSDPDDVKTLLELSGAQIKKRTEIIEEISNGNHIVYRNEEDDDLVIKRIGKSSSKNNSNLTECKIKREPSPVREPSIVKKPEDSVDVLMKNIGYKLRNMSEKQQIIAEYKIHEILFLGLSNQLTFPIDDGSQHYNYTMTAPVNADGV